MKIFLSIVLVICLGTVIMMVYWHQAIPLDSSTKNKPESSVTESNSLVESEHFIATQSATTAQPLADNFYKLPIIMYHYAEYVKNKKDILRQRLNINPDLLQKQLEIFNNAQFKTTFVKDINTSSGVQDYVQTRIIALTFDDGYADFYDNVYPLLKKLNMKATIYLISHKLDTPDYLKTSQVKEMLASGLIEVGAHTQSHPDLSKLSTQKAWQEIQGSKNDLQNSIGQDVRTFAYPSGKYTKDTISLVQKAGFQYAVTTHPSVIQNNQKPYELYRIRAGALESSQAAQILLRLNK